MNYWSVQAKCQRLEGGTTMLLKRVNTGIIEK